MIKNLSYDELTDFTGVEELDRKLTAFLKEREGGKKKQNIRFGRYSYRGKYPKDVSFQRWLQEKSVHDAEVAAGIRVY